MTGSPVKVQAELASNETCLTIELLLPEGPSYQKQSSHIVVHHKTATNPDQVLNQYIEFRAVLQRRA